MDENLIADRIAKGLVGGNPVSDIVKELDRVAESLEAMNATSQLEEVEVLISLVEMGNFRKALKYGIKMGHKAQRLISQTTWDKIRANSGI